MNEGTVKSLLVATDLMAGADDILRAAAALAAQMGAELHVVHALDLDLSNPPYQAPPEGRMGFPERIRAAERTLEEQIRRTAPPGTTAASQRVEIDVPHRAILARAAAVSADLIVLGPHRRRPFVLEGLGSTAARVLRAADAPCLILRGPLALPFRRVGIAIDLEDPARGTLSLALRRAQAFGDPAGTEVSILHVGGPADRGRGAALGRELEVLASDAAASLARAGGAGGLTVHPEMLWGESPAPTLTAYAREHALDLLVVSTHARRGVERLVLGSVADAVARGAPCSVLLVPPTRAWGGEEARLPASR